MARIAIDSKRSWEYVKEVRKCNLNHTEGKELT